MKGYAYLFLHHFLRITVEARHLHVFVHALHEVGLAYLGEPVAHLAKTNLAEGTIGKLAKMHVFAKHLSIVLNRGVRNTLIDGAPEALTAFQLIVVGLGVVHHITGISLAYVSTCLSCLYGRGECSGCSKVAKHHTGILQHAASKITNHVIRTLFDGYLPGQLHTHAFTGPCQSTGHAYGVACHELESVWQRLSGYPCPAIAVAKGLFCLLSRHTGLIGVLHHHALRCFFPLCLSGSGLCPQHCGCSQQVPVAIIPVRWVEGIVTETTPQPAKECAGLFVPCCLQVSYLLIHFLAGCQQIEVLGIIHAPVVVVCVHGAHCTTTATGKVSPPFILIFCIEFLATLFQELVKSVCLCIGIIQLPGLALVIAILVHGILLGVCLGSVAILVAALGQVGVARLLLRSNIKNGTGLCYGAVGMPSDYL